MTSVTTICIVGFSPDATPRELKNLCRFCSGFEDSHVAFAGTQGQASALFVKFADAEYARNAIEAIHGAPFDQDAPHGNLRAEFARREMEARPAAPWQSDRPSSRLPPPPVFSGSLPPPPVYEGSYGGSSRRSNGSGGGEPICTMTILGLRSKGLTVHEIEKWCMQRTGFVTMQVNERIDGVFCRFVSSHDAEKAIQEGKKMNWGAEWARRNLDDDGAVRAALPPPPAAPPPPPQFHGSHGPPPAKRSRTGGGDSDTVTVLGLNEKGLAHGDVQQWFQQRPGFLALQVNERIDALFVKFACHTDAENAIHDANDIGFGAEWARRNLDL
eukprot:TRINITY_DN7400_c0_g1_i1.p1 TRINITY_DN7400_c0_g1~~TRINITY_DN7400_c0_g1_i1.p1  ORF type:complete len:328 (+),score=64.60 TRINITY_DN7400_c0_g1_i1:198-1181(+)